MKTKTGTNEALLSYETQQSQEEDTQPRRVEIENSDYPKCPDPVRVVIGLAAAAACAAVSLGIDTDPNKNSPKNILRRWNTIMFAAVPGSYALFQLKKATDPVFQPIHNSYPAVNKVLNKILFNVLTGASLLATLLLWMIRFFQRHRQHMCRMKDAVKDDAPDWDSRLCATYEDNDSTENAGPTGPERLKDMAGGFFGTLAIAYVLLFTAWPIFQTFRSPSASGTSTSSSTNILLNP